MSELTAQQFEVTQVTVETFIQNEFNAIDNIVGAPLSNEGFEQGSIDALRLAAVFSQICCSRLRHENAAIVSPLLTLNVQLEENFKAPL